MPSGHSRVIRTSRNTGRVVKVLFVGTFAECELWLEAYGARTGCTKNTGNRIEAGRTKRLHAEEG